MDTNSSYRNDLLALLVLVTAGAAPCLYADVPPDQAHEVEYLLEFIRTSPCLFIRNGREYEGARAHRHVRRKYDYFRDQITTTERFIELSASLSTASGQPYSYRCDGESERPTREVLLQALAAYRSNRG